MPGEMLEPQDSPCEGRSPAPEVPPTPETFSELIPSFIDLGERGFIVHNRDDEPDVAKFDKMLAMTPTERLRWHDYWSHRVRNALLSFTNPPTA
jgi:hypothetical protein